MDWIKIITLGIALFTLVVLIYNVITLNENKQKDIAE